MTYRMLPTIGLAALLLGAAPGQRSAPRSSRWRWSSRSRNTSSTSPRSLDELVTETQAFTAAVKAGDVAKAKALFAPTRTHYEAIEPIAELFSDLDGSIDSRADDHEKAEKDPGFTGFHRIEYGLWVENSTAGLDQYADQLMADVNELHSRISGLVFPPDVVVGGAAALMEEVAATKISGEEDRYSRTDLWDFQANIDGSKKIWELFSPLIDGRQGLRRQGERQLRHRRHDPRRLQDPGRRLRELREADRRRPRQARRCGEHAGRGPVPAQGQARPRLSRDAGARRAVLRRRLPPRCGPGSS